MPQTVSMKNLLVFLNTIFLQTSGDSSWTSSRRSHRIFIYYSISGKGDKNSLFLWSFLTIMRHCGKWDKEEKSFLFIRFDWISCSSVIDFTSKRHKIPITSWNKKFISTSCGHRLAINGNVPRWTLFLGRKYQFRTHYGCH